MQYVNIDLKVPLLDAIDRFSIMELKRERLHDEKDRPSVENEYAFYTRVLDGYRADGVEIKDTWLSRMKAMNAKIWDVETDIRNGKRNHLTNEAVGRLAVKLRNLNDERGAMRNAMAEEIGNDFFDAGDGSRTDTSLTLPLHEAIDRITIGALKLERMANDKNRSTLEREYAFYTKVLDSYRASGIAIKDEWITGMKKINGTVWDMESAIRQGREAEFGLEEMGRRTLELRDLSKVRVAWKNDIARAVGSDFYEVKTETT